MENLLPSGNSQIQHLIHYSQKFQSHLKNNCMIKLNQQQHKIIIPNIWLTIFLSFFFPSIYLQYYIIIFMYKKLIFNIIFIDIENKKHRHINEFRTSVFCLCTFSQVIVVFIRLIIKSTWHKLFKLRIHYSIKKKAISWR